MKKIVLTTLLFICSLAFLNAQKRDAIQYITTFEDDFSFIEFEPAENNLWQVGRPHKAVFDSAYSAPFALMTDTLNMLTQPGKHSFMVKFERPWWSNAIPYYVFNFFTIYDFVQDTAGGYIEVSYDKGLSWYNVVADSNYRGDTIFEKPLQFPYGFKDSLINGIRAASNKNLQYNYTSRMAKTIGCFHSTGGEVHNLWLRFTYENTSICTAHGGWLIDNLHILIVHDCEFWESYRDAEISPEVNIYPNPVSDKAIIEWEEEYYEPLLLKVYAANGTKTFQKDNILGHTIELDCTKYKPGYYFYSLTNADKSVFLKGKFIKE